jgi:hypothetical protein
MRNLPMGLILQAIALVAGWCVALKLTNGRAHAGENPPS